VKALNSDAFITGIEIVLREIQYMPGHIVSLTVTHVHKDARHVAESVTAGHSSLLKSFCVINRR
jgi:hypothetical protein